MGMPKGAHLHACRHYVSVVRNDTPRSDGFLLEETFWVAHLETASLTEVTYHNKPLVLKSCQKSKVALDHQQRMMTLSVTDAKPGGKILCDH